ncbi:primase-like DNA-binding domain-containing protein [Bacillus sp. NPDC094106]|uniref:primase-like DNA-binding domain-containing protein n=1 Tax=Bacillus sp. NPDC094106 TaxID=3363949 RepID=UPI00380291B9
MHRFFNIFLRIIQRDNNRNELFLVHHSILSPLVFYVLYHIYKSFLKDDDYKNICISLPHINFVNQLSIIILLMKKWKLYNKIGYNDKKYVNISNRNNKSNNK